MFYVSMHCNLYQLARTTTRQDDDEDDEIVAAEKLLCVNK